MDKHLFGSVLYSLQPGIESFLGRFSPAHHRNPVRMISSTYHQRHFFPDDSALLRMFKNK